MTEAQGVTVIAGLAQLSDQLHNLSAYLLVVTALLLFTLTLLTAIAFVNGRA